MLFKLVPAWFLLLGCCLSVVFIVSGLLINLLQLILYVIVHPIRRDLYRKINYYLTYSIWAQGVTVYEWVSNSTCNVYSDEGSLTMFGKEHCIILLNHKYDFDTLIVWCVCNYFRVMGYVKICAKKQIGPLPVAGWSYFFAECVFLERNWQKDKLTMGGQLDNLAEYKDPMMLVFYPEGTRFTPEKHETSLKYAEANNFPPLYHHLYPRSRGFNFTAKHLKEKVPAIYNMQIGFRQSERMPTVMNLFLGYSFTADMYVERILLKDVPTDSDEATANWMHELYQRKDRLMDDYFKTETFPGKCIRIKRSYRPLINLITWGTCVGISALNIFYVALTARNPYVAYFVAALFAFFVSLVIYILGHTRGHKGSSYGTAEISPKKN